MKTWLFPFLILLLFSIGGCKKHRSQSNSLPPVTQQGKNTLGFLVNGQTWTPLGFSGTANLSIDYDPSFNNGVLGIVAYRTLSATDKTQFILGITDSLNFLSAPFTLLINSSSISGLSFSTRDYCDLLHTDSTIYQAGRITISTLDKSNRIIAGTFDGVLYKQICGDSIKITQGRFDMKY